MDSLVKRFGSSIPETKSWEYFAAFSVLNATIEQDNLLHDEVLQAYYDVMLKDEPIQGEQQIHRDIETLLSETRVAANRIHEFVWYKFAQLEEIAFSMITEIPIVRMSKRTEGEIRSSLSNKKPIKLYAQVHNSSRKNNEEETIPLVVTWLEDPEEIIQKFRTFTRTITEKYEKGAWIPIIMPQEDFEDSEPEKDLSLREKFWRMSRKILKR